MTLDTLTGMRVRAGQTLLTEGENSPVVYRVLEGRLASFRRGPDGPVKLFELTKGGFAGATSVIANRRQAFSVQGADVISFVKAYRSEDLEQAYENDDTVFPMLVEAIIQEGTALDRRITDQRIAKAEDPFIRHDILAMQLATLREEIASALQRVNDPAIFRSALNDLLNATLELVEKPTTGAVLSAILKTKQRITKAALLRTASAIEEGAERRRAMTDILERLSAATLKLPEQLS